MTLKQIYKEEHGEKGWKKLSPRVKKVVETIDSLPPLSEKPLTSRELKEALK